MPKEYKPDWYMGEFSSGPAPATKLDPSIQLDGHQLLKDFAVDAATQAPLMMIPGGGIAKTLLRAGSSIGAGTLTDQLLNNRPVADSLAEAGTNTGLSMLLPGLVENSVSVKTPEGTGTGVAAPFMRALHYANPANWGLDPRMMQRPGASVAVPQNLGNLVKDFLTQNKNIPMGVRKSVAGVPADTLDYVLKNGFGLGANTGFDATVNKPQAQK